MSYNELFYLVFMSQIVLISAIIPYWVSKRVNHILKNYTATEYPKLYPVKAEKIRNALNIFYILNGFMIVVGLVIMAFSIINASEELLNWDTQAVLSIYFLLQYLPFIFLGKSGLKYHQMMRQANNSTRRSAQLTPRSILNFVSPLELSLAVVTFLLHVIMVVYVQQNPFPGFVGYWNILFVFLLNVFYFIMIQFSIKGKKPDPHQSHDDRMNQINLFVKIMVLASIACNLFLTINLALSFLDLRHINDLIQSLYFSLIAIMMSQTAAYQTESYEVYKAESNTA